MCKSLLGLTKFQCFQTIFHPLFSKENRTNSKTRWVLRWSSAEAWTTVRWSKLESGPTIKVSEPSASGVKVDLYADELRYSWGLLTGSDKSIGDEGSFIDKEPVFHISPSCDNPRSTLIKNPGWVLENSFVKISLTIKRGLDKADW